MLISKPGRFQRAFQESPDRLKELLEQFDKRYFDVVKQNKTKSDTIIFDKLAAKTEKKDYPFNVKKILAFEAYIEPNMNILDFGGSNGEIAKAIQEFKTKVTVADVHIPAKKPPGIKYVELKEDMPLPFKNGEFDISCCFMVLHHIQNRHATLKELARVTKKFLFIQEHDAIDQMDCDLIDIQHGMYMYVTQTDDYDKTKNFDQWKAFYFSVTTLDKDLSTLGFKKIAYRVSARSGHTTKNYFATYVKV